MNVADVHRLTLSHFPISLSAPHARFSIFANRKLPQSTLSNRFSLVHYNHRVGFSQNVSGKSDAESELSYNEGELLDKNGTASGKNKNPFVSEELFKKLKKYGVSGILSYGILNTVYYTTAFLLVWFYVAPAPGKMGFLAAAERFLKVMAMVWAGSQVTKLMRIGGAIALAPIVDRGLSWFTVKFKFGSQGKAFGAIVGICLGLALMMFIVVTLLSA